MKIFLNWINYIGDRRGYIAASLRRKQLREGRRQHGCGRNSFARIYSAHHIDIYIEGGMDIGDGGGGGDDRLSDGIEEDECDFSI